MMKTRLKKKALFMGCLVLWTTSICQAQKSVERAEEELNAEIDRWMLPYRNEKRNAFVDWFEKAKETPDSLRRHRWFKRMNAFYEKHRKTYRRLRLKSLQAYGPSPTVFPGYQPLGRRHLEIDGIGLDSTLNLIQDVANIRTLGVEDTRSVQGMLAGVVLVYLSRENNMLPSELVDGLFFGDLLFADKIGPDAWRVTFLNRLYVISYRWNIRTNRIRDPAVAVYQGEKQQTGWPELDYSTRGTPKRWLYKKAKVFRWSLYDQEEGHSTARESLRGFMDANRDAYIQVREAALARLPEGDTLWRDGYRPADPQLKENLMNGLVVPDQKGRNVINPAEAVHIFGHLNVFDKFKMQISRITGNREDFVISWLAGDDVYARKLEGHSWAIHGCYLNHAISYTWNIATDELSDLQCWEKKR